MIAQRYRGTIEDDTLLAQWFQELVVSGDWSKCFMRPAQGIGWFYTYFQRDVQLWYVAEQGRLVLAGWFEPVGIHGAFFSLWIAPTHRNHRRMLWAFGELLEQAFETCHIVLGITQQEALLDGHQKMGYTVVGVIPGLYPGRTTWLVSITADQLRGGLYGRQRRRQHACHGSARG